MYKKWMRFATAITKPTAVGLPHTTFSPVIDDRYIAQALNAASYEQFDDSTWYAEIERFPGVYATAATQAACRAELHDVVRGWIEVRLRHNLSLPAFAE